MRVIAGSAKGRRLKSPRDSTRPTTELVRGAIFSILQAVVNSQSRVLDLYAGSGALGIEALSRGAGWADFVEHDPGCCAVIKENVERTGFASQTKVYCCGVSQAISVLSGKYDVILLDPPYSDPSLVNTLTNLLGSQLVGTGSNVVVQHSPHLSLPQDIKQFHLVKSRNYGDTCLSIYGQEDAN